MRFNDTFWYTLDSDVTKSVIGASPRSWAKASEVLENLTEWAKLRGKRLSLDDVEAEVAKSVGNNIAIEFVTFIKLIAQYSQEDIKNIFSNPAKAPLPPKAKKGDNYELAASNAIILVACRYKSEKTLSPEEWNNFNEYLVKLNYPSLATKGIKLMFELHPEMHEELGEEPGHDKYRKGVDIYHDKYGYDGDTEAGIKK